MNKETETLEALRKAHSLSYRLDSNPNHIRDIAGGAARDVALDKPCSVSLSYPFIMGEDLVITGFGRHSDGFMFDSRSIVTFGGQLFGSIYGDVFYASDELRPRDATVFSEIAKHVDWICRDEVFPNEVRIKIAAGGRNDD